MARHVDPYRAIDRQPDPQAYVDMMESRARMPSQVRLRRRFLRFCGVRRGHRVLEVGAGTGAVSRDLARMVGPRGRVTGLDPSRVFVAAARRLAREEGLDGRLDWRVGDGARLPFRAGRFDCAIAVTVLLHVPNGSAILSELVRVTRSGGVVAVQDQDMGTLVLDHPDRALTRRILEGVAARTYADPFSGRTLRRQLVELGLERVRLLTAVYQDTTFESFTRSMLGRRAENAVRLGLVGATAAARWLGEIERMAAGGRFTLTLNFYGAAGVKPLPRGGRPR
ncbi:MAG TPA: methyltransferase domain-containing protein [Methylomirabilota bacterium]|nr:methyltransferase domain-containing protein [Methylomirabilota bacterium]